MKKIYSLALVGAALALSVPATAQFVISGTNMVSEGAYGNAGNSSVSATVGTSSIYTSLNLSGTLVSGNVGSWASESVMAFDNFATGGFGDFRGSLNGNTFQTESVNRTVDVLFFANAGDTWDMQSYESFDDTGTDATWTDATATFRGSLTAMSLGVLGSDVVFDTFLSTLDTELGVYDSMGNLLADNDDTTGGPNGDLQSRVELTGLAAGKYYVVAGGWNIQFSDQLAISGPLGDSDAGDVLLSVNGNLADTTTVGSNELAIYEFEVVPEPATMTLLSLGALVAFRKRNKKA